VHWGAAWAAVHRADPLLLLVAGTINFASLVLKGGRWWIFLRAIGSPSIRLAVQSTVVGAGVDNLLVANSGDATRVLVLARRSGLPKATVLATLIVERMFDLLSFALLLLGSVMFLPLDPDLARFRWLAVALLAGVLAVLALLVWHAPEDGAEPRFAEPGHRPGLFSRLHGAAVRFVRASAALASVERFVAATLLSLVVWIGQLATYHLIARAAHFPITVAGSLAALLAVNVGLVVRATPGNVGLFQLVYAAAAATLGLSKDSAVGVAFLIQTLQIIPVTAVALALAPGVLLHRREVADEIAHMEDADADDTPSVADRRRAPRPRVAPTE
jgi:hypothetical protein